MMFMIKAVKLVKQYLDEVGRGDSAWDSGRSEEKLEVRRCLT